MRICAFIRPEDADGTEDSAVIVFSGLESDMESRAFLGQEPDFLSFCVIVSKVLSKKEPHLWKRPNAL